MTLFPFFHPLRRCTPFRLTRMPGRVTGILYYPTHTHTHPHPRPRSQLHLRLRARSAREGGPLVPSRHSFPPLGLRLRSVARHRSPLLLWPPPPPALVARIHISLSVSLCSSPKTRGTPPPLSRPPFLLPPPPLFRSRDLPRAACAQAPPSPRPNTTHCCTSPL